MNEFFLVIFMTYFEPSGNSMLRVSNVTVVPQEFTERQCQREQIKFLNKEFNTLERAMLDRTACMKLEEIEEIPLLKDAKQFKRKVEKLGKRRN